MLRGLNPDNSETTVKYKYRGVLPANTFGTQNLVGELVPRILTESKGMTGEMERK